VLAALFDPDPAQDADARASGTPGSTLTGPQPGTLPSPAAEMPEFANQVLSRLFSAGVSL